jgi:hypothetical protein
VILAANIAVISFALVAAMILTFLVLAHFARRP